MPPKDGSEPVRSYVDPRIEIYAPTEGKPYYRIRGYDAYDNRVVDTTAGRSLKAAQAKAARIARRLHKGIREKSRDPARVLAHAEAAEWLVPTNHRTRANKPWSARHAENMEAEWRLRISPFIPRRATVQQLADKQLWVRILNEAQACGLAASSVQKTGQACRSLISWLMDRGLLDTNPMRGVSYSVTKVDNAGFDPKAVRPEEIPNFELVYRLAWEMAWAAWPNRPGRGGHRQSDAVGPRGRAIQPVLVATTGLRNGELFALRPSHIDLTDLEIHICQQLVETNAGERSLTAPKHGSIRTVTFAGFLQHDLKDLIDHRRQQAGQDDPIIFCAPRGGLEWRTNHTDRFRAAARRAGWPDHFTWYGLRHLYAVTMLEHLPLEVVSRLMGHHSPDFTAKRYLSLRVGWLDQARAVSRVVDPFESESGVVDDGT